jgi:hypothetical protein
MAATSLWQARPIERAHSEAVRQRRFNQLWLDTEDEGLVLGVLANGAHAWLMYLRHKDGDPGLVSRNPDYTGPEDDTMEFELSNGQVDAYPVAWTLPLEQALAACEYFFETCGGRSPDILWHDDALSA